MCISWNRNWKNQHTSPDTYNILRYFKMFPGYFHDIHQDSTTQPSRTCSFNGIGFAGADRGGGLASILQQGDGE